MLSGAVALHGLGGSAAPPAEAATAAVTASGSSFTFKGSGWGHGIGMSQYGARGMASGGATHTQILQHYYTGVTVAASTTGVFGSAAFMARLTLRIVSASLP